MYLWIVLRRNDSISDYFKWCFDSHGIFSTITVLRFFFILERHAFKTPCHKPSDRMSQTCHILSLKREKKSNWLKKIITVRGFFIPELPKTHTNCMKARVKFLHKITASSKQCNWKGKCSYLSFCEAKAVCELFPLCSDHIMVFLKSVFEPQKLRRWKSCPDSFGLSGQRVV